MQFYQQVHNYIKYLMKIASFILVLCLLVGLSYAQRGGGSRSSSRSSSSRRSSWGSGRRRSTWGSWWGSSTNQTNSTTTDGSTSSSNADKWLQLGGIIGAFGFIGYYTNKSSKENQQKRKIEFAQLFDAFVEQRSQNREVGDEILQVNKDYLLKRNWVIRYETANRSFNDKAVVTITEIKVRDSRSLELHMSLADSVGGSLATGVAVPLVETEGMAIMFQKTYNNRQDAGQTGSFDKLIYRGEKVENQFKGTWAYQNYENNNEYSGTWTMYSPS